MNKDQDKNRTADIKDFTVILLLKLEHFTFIL